MKDETSIVSLYTMHRIEMLCGNTCQKKKLGPVMTGLEKQMKDAYADLQVIIYVSAIGGFISLFYCLYLVSKKSQATQQEYVNFWGFTIFVLLIVTIMLCLFVVKMSRRYSASRANLLAVRNCITNTSWKKLVTNLHTMTNMNAEHNWGITWLTFGLLLIVVMGYFFMNVSA